MFPKLFRELLELLCRHIARLVHELVHVEVAKVSRLLKRITKHRGEQFYGCCLCLLTHEIQFF